MFSITLLSFDAPSPGNPRKYPQKTLQTLYCQYLESLGYIFAADSAGLSSFKFSWWAPKTYGFDLFNWKLILHSCALGKLPPILIFSTFLYFSYESVWDRAQTDGQTDGRTRRVMWRIWWPYNNWDNSSAATYMDSLAVGRALSV